MAERLVLTGFDEISQVEDDVRGIKLIKSLGEEQYDEMMQVLYMHLRQTIDTVSTFGVIVPTIGMYMTEHTDGRSMLVMHVSAMNDEELSKSIPRLEESATKYKGKFILVSAEATLAVKQLQDDDEVDEYEIDGIKTTIYHKDGIVDLISEIETNDNMASLSKPMIIKGLGDFDHLFDHILTGMVLQ